VKRLKKIAAILILICTLNIPLAAYSDTANTNSHQELDLVGESAILIDRDTGQVLYEKNPHKQLFPASTTKIMTGILAIEKGNLSDTVTIDEEVIKEVDGSHIALEPGEQLTLEELLNALLIESANDAAVAIAIHISGTVENFVELMNEKARDLGALNTHFTNPNGLPSNEHVTTAYDLSLMAKYAMKNKVFKDIVKNYTYTIPITNKKDEERCLFSSNRLLYSNKKIEINEKVIPIKYDGVDGVKSGYTGAAKQCLVSSATKNNQRLIAVVLKSEGRYIYTDSHKLLNYGFDNFEKATISFENEFIDNIPIKKGTTPFVAGILKDGFITNVPKGKENRVQKKITIFEDNTVPIKQGDSLGKIEYYLNDKKLGQADIVSTLTVEKMPLKNIILSFLGKIWWIILITIFILLTIKYIFYKKKSKRGKEKYIYGNVKPR